MDNKTEGPAADAGPAAADPVVAAKPRHVRQADRFRVVPLDWPIEFDGVTYDKVTVSRMTTAQVAEFTLAARTDGATAVLPMFDAPQAVIDALDADDADNVNKAVHDFLPRSFRDMEASSPADGENMLASQLPGSEAKA